MCFTVTHARNRSRSETDSALTLTQTARLEQSERRDIVAQLDDLGPIDVDLEEEDDEVHAQTK